MMRYIILLAFSLVILSCGNTKPYVDSPVGTDLKEMLPEGCYELAVYDSIAYPAELYPLAEKYKKAIIENPDWYVEALTKMQQLQTDKPPYSPKSGLTEKEFETYYDLLTQMKLIMSKTGVIVVSHLNNTIRFAGDTKSSMLPFFQIKTDSNEVHISDYHLTYRNKAESNINLLNLSWKGYQWEYSYNVPDELEDLATADSVGSFKTTIGRAENAEFIVVELNVVKSIAGQQPIKFDHYYVLQKLDTHIDVVH